MSEEYFQEGQVWEESDFAVIPECHSQKIEPKKVAPKKRKITSTPLPSKKKQTLNKNKNNSKTADDLFDEEDEMLVDVNFITPELWLKKSNITNAPKKSFVSNLNLESLIFQYFY